MANLKLNNVVVVAESSGVATLQNIDIKTGTIKADDGTAAITIADSSGVLSLSAALASLAVTGATTLSSTLAVTGATTFSGAVTVPTATASGHAVTKAQLDASGIDGITSTGSSASDTVTVAGHLTVNGTTTTINSTTVEVKDNILQLNTTQASPDTATAATSGISVYRGNGVTQASLIFDDADDTWDITNNLKVAGSVQSGDLILNNINSTANEVDGTRGHWTIQEGETDLFIMNRVTNKKYKFNLTEIENATL